METTANPMRIALVSQEYPPETAKGGIGTQTFSKAQGLASLGHEVYVVSRSVDGARYQLRQGAVTIIRIPGFEDRMGEMTDVVQWITYSALVAAELEQLHERVGLDLVDFPEWGAEGFVFLLNRTSWKTVPVFIQLHGPLVMFGQAMHWPDIDSPFYKTGTHMEAMCIRLADAVYSSSACSADWVRSHYDAERDDIPTIHLGIDTARFSPRPDFKNSRPTIVFVGRIVPNKGITELVEAALRLANDFPGLCLRIIGWGEDQLIEHLKHRAAIHKLPDLLVIDGFLSKEELPEALRGADIFAAPSYYEGGPGFVYLEAMACGLPVIGCSGSGVEEIITPGETGLLVPPRDIDALEFALRKMLCDPPAGQAIGARAREFVMEHADSRNCILKLEAFYRSVLARLSSKIEASI